MTTVNGVNIILHMNANRKRIISNAVQLAEIVVGIELEWGKDADGNFDLTKFNDNGYAPPEVDEPPE